MMKRQNISYLRLSVTKNCDMACKYCMPSDSLPPSLEGRGKGEGEISFDEITRIVRGMAARGVSKVRLTGGEPLVRKDILTLIRMLSAIDGIDTIALTTNGTHLAAMADELKAAGVSSVNIHIDSLVPAVHRWITGSDLLNETLGGIEAALSAGFREVKLNTVLMRDVNDNEVEDLIAFAESKGIPIRFIELMPIGAGAELFGKYFLSVKDVIARLSKQGELLPVIIPSPLGNCVATTFRHRESPEGRRGDPVKSMPYTGLLRHFVPRNDVATQSLVGEGKGEGRGPARYFKITESGAIVGFIGHTSMPACADCNRIRLLSDGTIKNCLAKIDNVSMHAIGG